MMLEMNEKNQETIDKRIRKNKIWSDEEETNKLSIHFSRIAKVVKLKMDKQ